MRILFIEDSPTDALILNAMLVNCGLLAGTAVTHVRTLGEGLRSARESLPDVVLLDLGLPDSATDQTFAAARAAIPATVPIVILSGLEDEEAALKSLAAGAQDYLPKNELTPATVRRAVQYAAERSRLMCELEASRTLYRSFFQSVPVPCLVYDDQTL